MAALHVTRWTTEEFLGGRAAWQALLESSDADPLFMSWDWMSIWWRHHATVLRADLYVLAIRTPAGELAGIAPFYRHRAVHLGFLGARRLELLGNAWRDPAAIFGEYLDIVARRGAYDAVCAAVRDWLNANREWDELVFCNVHADSAALRLARLLGADDRASGSSAGVPYLRAAEAITGWSVALPGSFASFVTRLSSNTRRKVVHQREKLTGASFETVPAAQHPEALARLDAWVAGRFGAPAGSDAQVRARFHAELVASAADLVHLTELRAAGTCLSVMLNLRLGGTEYYLQSGFDAAHARGLSPGLLHLGYAIEAACRDGVTRFDFLAGRGLHRDYKQDFAAESVPLQTVHVVRKPALRALFRVADRLRGRTSHKTRIGG